MQIVLNIVLSFSIYLLISIPFSYAYMTNRFINISFAGFITLSGYIFYIFYNYFSLNFFISIFSTLTISILIYLLIDIIAFRKLNNRKSEPFILLIASLGIYIVIIHAIAMVFGSDVIILRKGNIHTVNIFGARILYQNVFLILSSILVSLILTIFLYKTHLGIKIRAVASNELLSNVIGINSLSIKTISNLITIICLSLLGIFIGFDSGLYPTMSFNIFLYGLIVLIISGVGEVKGIFLGAFLLAAAQHIGAYYISSQWTNAIAYIILILFLIWKPLGFSGRRMKKVEI